MNPLNPLPESVAQSVAKSRNTILNALRTARDPFNDIPEAGAYLPMVPLADQAPAALKSRFVEEAEKLACVVHQPPSATAAVEEILALLASDTSIISWDLEKIPAPNLATALDAAGVGLASPDDPSVRVGLSGADVALAATGSLVIRSGAGQARTASLLPPVHIAVIREDQIVADFESWVATQRQDGLEVFHQSSNIVLVSGASRTADIAMQLILGMHGPGKLHIVLVPAG